MAEQLSPGIIGQMYENRRKPGEFGVLESRDEKYKTLMFRDSEGKSFAIAYSSFRSNWRKYTGDEVVETSTQKQEEAKKEEQKLEVAKENLKEPKKGKIANVEDRRTRTLSEEDSRKLQEDGALIIKNAVEKYSHDGLYTLKQVEMTKKHQIKSTVYAGRFEVVEIWIKNTKSGLGKCGFHTKKAVFNETVFSEAIGKVEGKENTSPHEKRPIAFDIPTDLLEIAIRDILDSVAGLFTNKEEQ